MKPSNKPSRVSAFVLEKKTGNPLAGVPAAAVAETEEGEQIPLGVLASDHTGYLSFDLGPLFGRADIAHVWVYRLGDRAGGVDVLAPGDGAAAPGVVELNVDSSPFDRHPPGSGFPSIQNPGLPDRRLSPGSFASNPGAVIGEGGCELLLPSDKAVREFRFRQIVRDLEGHESANSFSNPVRLWGHVLEYRMSFYPEGHSLGGLLYSLPLAPCESVNLAVVEWSRRDEAQREETLEVRERLLHSERRDRTIEETVRASLDELQRGGSIMGGLAGSYGAQGGMSVSGAIGGAYTSSGGERDVAAHTVQKLSDNVIQASTAVRTLQGTIVVSASQAERDAIQTRTVTNHNHCHAMTVLYYEVVRHFRVVTECISKQEVLLIRNDAADFDRESAFCHREILERVLLRPDLRPCFAAVDRLLHCTPPELLEEAEVAPAPAARVATKLVFTISTGDWDAGGTDGDVKVLLRLKDGSQREFVPSHRGNPFEAGNEDTFDFELDPTLDPAQIQKIGIHFRLGGLAAPWDLQGLKAEYLLEEGGGLQELFDKPDIHSTFKHTGSKWWDVVPVEQETEDPQAKLRERVSRDRCCEERLLAHLNCNKLYYYRAIWMQEDPDARAYRFSRIHYGNGTLLDVVENRALGLWANYVAFPHRTEEPFSSADEASILAETYVALPTRGVFAEAQLSHCNACEEKDVTRFWDWSESPCPEKAPEISGIQPGSRAQQPDMTPATMPSSVVNIVNPPPAPDPTAMASAMALLGTPNIFRDMSGVQEVSALLQKLAEGTISLEQASNQARQIQDRKGAAGAGAADKPGGGFAGGGDAMRPSPSQQHDQLQVYRDAEKHGELTPDERQDMGRAFLQEAQYQEGLDDYDLSTDVYSGQVNLEDLGIDNVVRGYLLFADFAVSHTELTPEHEYALDEVIRVMESVPDAYILSIEGRASQTGDEANNEDLGVGRASAVERYLLDNGLDAGKIGSVRGYGSRSPLRDRPDLEVAINRSAMLNYSLPVEPPPSVTEPPVSRPDGSNRWAIRVTLGPAGIHSDYGVAFVQGELKNRKNGQVRAGAFQGFGIGLGVLSPGAQPGQADWVNFRTNGYYDFEDFDGTLARLTVDAAGLLLVGTVTLYISFPLLGANSLHVWHLNMGSIGVDLSTNVGWWNVIGEG